MFWITSQLFLAQNIFFNNASAQDLWTCYDNKSNKKKKCIDKHCFKLSGFVFSFKSIQVTFWIILLLISYFFL